MAKLGAKQILIEAFLSLVLTGISFGILKYVCRAEPLPESFLLIYLLFLIYLRITQK